MSCRCTCCTARFYQTVAGRVLCQYCCTRRRTEYSAGVPLSDGILTTVHVSVRCFVYLLIKNRGLFAVCNVHDVSEPLAAALEAWPWKNPQGILVSPMDKRHYRWLILPNGLQVRVYDTAVLAAMPSVFCWSHVSRYTCGCDFVAQSDLAFNDQR